MGCYAGRGKGLDLRSPAPHIAGMPDTAKPEPKPATPAKPAAKPDSKAGDAEYGGPKGPEPTRYGDWEKNGRCSDF